MLKMKWGQPAQPCAFLRLKRSPQRSERATHLRAVQLLGHKEYSMKPKHKANCLFNLREQQYRIHLALYHQEHVKHVAVMGADHWHTHHSKRKPGLWESSRWIVGIFTQVWVFHSKFFLLFFSLLPYYSATGEEDYLLNLPNSFGN